MLFLTFIAKNRNIRNINKKIVSCSASTIGGCRKSNIHFHQSNASKIDSVISEHSGKSIDELVEARIINADQKAQIQKKPALQTQVAQLEEQLVQYQKVHDQYQTKAASDKSEHDKLLEQAKTDASKQSKDELREILKGNFLLLSQFLRLAAYRREEGQDSESDESQAIEGVLLAVYSGDENAVNAMVRLVDGSDEQVTGVSGTLLETTCKSHTAT